MKHAPELALRHLGQERVLCAKLRRKYGVDVCSSTGELVAYKQARERGAVLRQLAAHGGAHSAEQCLQILESMGQFFDWRQSLLEVRGAGGEVGWEWLWIVMPACSASLLVSFQPRSYCSRM